MKVLVVGGGGREHALAWKLAQSPRLSKLYCAPGNAGMAELGEMVDIGAEDIPALQAFAVREGIDLTVVGPEMPLVDGIVDAFSAAGLKVFGPSREAAQMEGSKAFAKRLMLEEGIPTGRAEIFEDYDSALKYLRSLGAPVVVKADGLAAGKGVIIADSLEMAEDGAAPMHGGRPLRRRRGARCSSRSSSRARKHPCSPWWTGRPSSPWRPPRITSVSGTETPAPTPGAWVLTAPSPPSTRPPINRVVEEVLQPTASALVKRGIHFRGILYAGVILTADGPKVLEYNVRFGDPETQAVLPRLSSDLLEAMLAVAEGRLSGLKLDWSDEPCVTLVMASGGYPGDYEQGLRHQRPGGSRRHGRRSGLPRRHQSGRRRPGGHGRGAGCSTCPAGAATSPRRGRRLTRPRLRYPSREPTTVRISLCAS